MALPKPEHGGSISSLRRFVNVKEDDWVLFVSWLIAAFRPKGPYPILGLKGEQGSAKTTIGRVARQLIDPFMIDPFKAPMRTKPPNERDLMITASNSYLITLDNLSHLSPWLSDALCRLATGGGLATRQLYTDDEEIIFDAQRPTLLNGIEKEASDIALESSPVATAVYEFMRDKNKWEGTFGDLLGSLNSRVNNGSRTGRSLPISARALSSALTRLSPSLRNAGITLDRLPREARTGRRLIRLENTRAAEPRLAQSPQPQAVHRAASDDSCDDWREDVSGARTAFSKGGDGVTVYAG